MEPDYTNDEDRELYGRGYNDGYEDAGKKQQDAQLLAQFARALVSGDMWTHHDDPERSARIVYEAAEALLAEHKKRTGGE